MHESGKISGLFFRTRSYEKLLSGKITPGAGKVQAVAHTLEMGTYKVVKHLLDNVGTMYDFRKSGLYKHMKFRDVDEAILDGVKQFLDEKAA